MNKNIAILILAAGESFRMGRTKQLLPFKGNTLLGHTILQAKNAKIGKVYCVLGADFETILEKEDDPEIEIIINYAWRQGLSTSIIAGIRLIERADYQFDAILIMLADQPYVDANYLRRICAQHLKNPNKLIASTYPKKLGVPALFPKNYFSQLLALSGDVGAGRILNDMPENVIGVLSADLLKDIDTPEDYNALE